MEQVPQLEPQVATQEKLLLDWLGHQREKVRGRLKTLLGSPKLFLTALAMVGLLSEMKAQLPDKEDMVEASVSGHLLDGHLDGDDAIGFVFAPMALELNLGSEPDIKEFAVDFVYGGKQFDVAEVTDSTEVAAMQAELQEKLRETMRQDFMSLYGPFLRQHIKEGYVVDDWAETDFGREYLTSIKSIQIRGHASPEAEKYGASALNPLSEQVENQDLAQKRAAFVSDVLQKLFSEAGISGADVQIDVMSKEDQFSSVEFSQLRDLAEQLGFAGHDSMAQIHQLLMLYNGGHRERFSEAQLKEMRQLVDSKRVVEVEITTDAGGTKKLVIPLPVLVFLSGYLLSLALRRRKGEESEEPVKPEGSEYYALAPEEPAKPEGSEYSASAPTEPQPVVPISRIAELFGGRMLEGGVTSDTRVFSESVQLPESSSPQVGLSKIDQQAMARILAEREFGERMINPEARKRGLDYQTELSNLAGEYEMAALEVERQKATAEVFGDNPLEPLAKDIQEWAFAKKNLEREVRYANSLPDYGGGRKKKKNFASRWKALAATEKQLKRRLDHEYSKYNKALATATLKAHCRPAPPDQPKDKLPSQDPAYQVQAEEYMQEMNDLTNRFMTAQMQRSLSGVAEQEAHGIWEAMAPDTIEAEEIQNRIDKEASKAVWGFVIPLSKESTKAEVMVVDPLIREPLARKTAQRMLRVWQDHDRSFDTSPVQEQESFLGQSKAEEAKLEPSGKGLELRDINKSGAGDETPRERESFMRLQRLRYPTAEQSVVDEEELRLRSLDYSESPEIRLWGDFWADKVAGPIAERAIQAWTRSMREAGTMASTHHHTLNDFIRGYVKQFVSEHAGESARLAEKNKYRSSIRR